MTKESAKLLWVAIINFTHAFGSLCDEGNSGEFHDAKTAKALDKDAVDNLNELLVEFKNQTGWLPVWTGKYPVNDDWYDISNEKFWDFNNAVMV